MFSQHQNYVYQAKKLHLLITLIAVMSPLCIAYATKGALSSTTAEKIDVSSFDSRVQDIAQIEIVAAVKNQHAKSGAIAVADPRTEKLIAFAQSGDGKNFQSWKSRLFSPGSTIKPFVAAAAIDSGVASESQVYDCRSPYYVDGVEFRNYENNFTDASLSESMAKSVNVCMVKVAQSTDSATLRKTLSQFGLNVDWQSSKSTALQLANLSIGKNTITTLADITKAYAILANKGHLFARNDRSAVKESTADSVTHMLVEAVQTGTGKRAVIDGLNIAGKTGTLAVENNGTTTLYLALFGGYFPAESPRFVSFVVIESNDKTASGGSLAALVFRTMAIKSVAKN